MSKKKRPKFLHIWVNQIELGRKFDLSPVAMGEKLITLGLKNHDGTPTQKALTHGFCQFKLLKDGTPFYKWNENKVVEIFKGNGLIPLTEVPNLDAEN
jgi:hypothetical protein